MPQTQGMGWVSTWIEHDLYEYGLTGGPNVGECTFKLSTYFGVNRRLHKLLQIFARKKDKHQYFFFWGVPDLSDLTSCRWNQIVHQIWMVIQTSNAVLLMAQDCRSFRSDIIHRGQAWINHGSFVRKTTTAPPEAPNIFWKNSITHHQQHRGKPYFFKLQQRWNLKSFETIWIQWFFKELEGFQLPLLSCAMSKSFQAPPA